MLTILHAADFHLDSPFAGLTPEKSAVRRRELRQLPGRLAELAKEQKADLVLLPGDLFDGERVHPETVDSLLQAFRDMAVPVFIAPGNHDYYHSRSPYATALWPDNVHIFTGAAMEAMELPDLNCVVHGCAFTAPHREDDPLAGFSVPDDGKTHLLCVHGEVAQAGTYAPISPGSLAACGAQYAALGHIHAAASGTGGSTLWAYPGCPEGRGFDELGPKGVLRVAFGQPATLTVSSPDGPPAAAFGIGTLPVAASFVPLCQRQYRIEAVNIEDFETALPREPSPDLVRFRLIGESERPLDLDALTRLAAQRFFYAELRDETTLPQDLWARAGEDSLTGLFLRQMKDRLDRAGEDERPGLLLAARFGLAALEGGEDIRP